MDGKSRWADNIMIERWFRSFKYEEAYLTQYNNIKEARAAINDMFTPITLKDIILHWIITHQQNIIILQC